MGFKDIGMGIGRNEIGCNMAICNQPGISSQTSADQEPCIQGTLLGAKVQWIPSNQDP
jgi:hypothetical protein